MLPEQFFLITFILFTACSAIRLFYYWGIFSRLSFYKKKSTTTAQEPVSVVIAAKNEFYNLQDNLPLILEQDYPDFEVVVVNDCSDDDTQYLLKDLADKYPHLKIVHLTHNVNFFSGKKFPLSMGIKSAKNEILLLTDADCKPASKLWIANMQRNFTDDIDIVLGYSPYEDSPGMLGKLIHYDTFQIAMQYLSYPLMGQAYMGVGRNLAYRKSVFYKHKGFTDHYKVKSGDDDLFINQAATKTNTAIEVSPESYTFSAPKKTFSAWFRQKKRHLSTGYFYKFKFKMWLGLFAMSQMFMMLSLPILLISLYNLPIVLSILGAVLLSHLFIFKKSMNQLGEKNILLPSLAFEAFFIAFNPILALLNKVVRDTKWK